MRFWKGVAALLVYLLWLLALLIVVWPVLVVWLRMEA